MFKGLVGIPAITPDDDGFSSDDGFTAEGSGVIRWLEKASSEVSVQALLEAQMVCVEVQEE
jgi:hypothetical protein